MANRLVFSELFQHMNFLVLEKDSDGRFTLASNSPAWFGQFDSDVLDIGDPVNLLHKFPFLDNFLIDAEQHWSEGEQVQLTSGVWIEAGMDGVEYPLDATAFNIEKQHILTVQHLGDSYQAKVETLQVARENMLNNEMLEEEVIKRTKLIRDREEQIAMRLLSAAGMRDQETGAHVRRIGLYSEVIALALGWDKQRADDIRLAAPMHDLGKIGIPDHILQKPGKLTPDEYKHMQLHPVIGADMLKGSTIPLLTMATEIARSHHEKWDGSGYPQGLSGKDIPISARIVALVDVYDALIHKRVYKKAMPEKDVLAYINEHSGTHFDPELVDIFIKLLPKISYIKETVVDEQENLPLNIASD